MLYQVLHAIEAATAPLSLDELSQQLGVERGVLEGMIAFWVRKGRLMDSSACPAATPGCSCSSHPDGCIFDRAAARTIKLSHNQH